MGLSGNVGDSSNPEPQSTRFAVLFFLIVPVFTSVLNRGNFLLFILIVKIIS